MQNILVISNDKIFLSNNYIYTDFNDTSSIIQTIQDKFNISLISRVSSRKGIFSAKLNSSNKIIRFNFFSLPHNFTKKLKIFMISITPRNFLYFLIIKFLYKNVDGFIYLRSNGHKEYQNKIGFFGYYIFDIMFKILKNNLKILTVSRNIVKTSSNFILRPSELDNNWFVKKKNKKNSFPKIMYFGRFKKEKGIYSLIELSKKFDFDYRLSLCGDNKNILNTNNLKINFIEKISNVKKIIRLYDNHDIFILPSYTEGYPKVILESLARKVPIIIFKEIKHVTSNFKGIFVCERNFIHLNKKIKFVFKNYKKIQSDMKKNILPTKKNFQTKLIKILDEQTN